MANSGSGFGDEKFDKIPMAYPVDLENMKDVISHNKEYFKTHGIHVNGSDYDLENPKYHCTHQHNYYQITNGVNYQHVTGGHHNIDGLSSRTSSYSHWGGTASPCEISSYCGESKDIYDSETSDEALTDEINYVELGEEMNSHELAMMSDEEREQHLLRENHKKLAYKIFMIILLCLAMYGIIRVLIFVIGLLPN